MGTFVLCALVFAVPESVASECFLHLSDFLSIQRVLDGVSFLYILDCVLVRASVLSCAGLPMQSSA